MGGFLIFIRSIRVIRVLLCLREEHGFLGWNGLGGSGAAFIQSANRSNRGEVTHGQKRTRMFLFFCVSFYRWVEIVFQGK